MEQDSAQPIGPINMTTLVQTWTGVLKQARKAKEPFSETAKICSHFFCGATDFMWSGDFHTKFLSGIPAPTFKVTVAKAFEFVSVVGPTLMWDYPGRVVSDYPPLEIPIDAFGDPNDPYMGAQVQMQYQQYQVQYQHERNVNAARNQLMERYLNESQKLQPGGGLKFDSHLAIIEAIVKGRGCLRVDAYHPQGTDESLTGCFFMSVDDLFIDPDCRRANLTDAKWMAIRHVDPRYEVEKRFGWPDGSLRKYTNMESSTSAGTSTTAEDGMWRTLGGTNDLVVWYEIFSRCGVGTRLKTTGSQVMPEWHRAFEKSVGDFAYVCIVDGMNEPLNAPAKFMEVASMDDVRAAMDWPVPFYRDNRWPVAMLDFWCQPNSPWPIAPLSMGLGELIFINTIMASMMDRIYRGGLTKMAIKQEVIDDAVTKLKSYSHEVIGLNGNQAQNINELVSYLEQPGVNYDVFQILEYVSQQFNRRVGLMDMLYGDNPGGKVDRSAAATNNKSEAVSVRPEWMSRKVEEFQSELANMERIAAGWKVEGRSLVGLLGQWGADLWDRLIAQEDPVAYVRDMRCMVEANSARRPNRARDNDNLQRLAQIVVPVLQSYFQMTGNPEPLNGFIEAIGKAIEQETQAFLMPPMQPPQQEGPTPEEQAMQQQMQQLAMAKAQQGVVHSGLKNLQLRHQMAQEGQAMDAGDLAGVEPAGEED